jgi:RHS repeat-associated protein
MQLLKDMKAKLREAAEERETLAETLTRDGGNIVNNPNLVQRYQLSNNIESATLELDETASIISYEEYYPYGDTSYQAGKNITEVGLKRYRYTGKEKDEESGLYYYGARYYVCWLGRWAASDPMANELPHQSSYMHCSGNPISRIDPSGLVDVEITEYAKTYGKAEITYDNNDDKTKGLNVTFGGKSLRLNEGEYSSKDGHLIGDDSKFVNAFGVGTDGFIVYKDAVTENVSIRAAFNISASYDLKGAAYKELFLKGIKETWTCNFENEGYEVATYAKESPDGIKVNIVDKSGISQNESSFFSKWPFSKLKDIKMFTRFEENGKTRTSQQFKYTAAHEFGHILGLKDSPIKGSNNIMRWYGEGPNAEYKVNVANVQWAVKVNKIKK